MRKVVARTLVGRQIICWTPVALIFLTVLDRHALRSLLSDVPSLTPQPPSPPHPGPPPASEHPQEVEENAPGLPDAEEEEAPDFFDASGDRSRHPPDDLEDATTTRDAAGLPYLTAIKPMDMWSVGAASAPKKGNQAPFDTSFAPPLPAGCPANRFLYVTMGYGQHNNQLIAVLNALAIAGALNRTLIMGPFIHMAPPDPLPGVRHTGPRKPQRQFVDPRYLYSWSGYRQQSCFVHHAEFFLRNPAPHHAICLQPRKDNIRRFDVICTRTVPVRRQQGERALQKARAVLHRLVYVPEAYWLLPRTLSRNYVPLAPSEPIRQEVRRFKQEALRTDGDRYTAVHLRNFEGKCAFLMSRLLWAINATESQHRAAPQQCEMSPRYIATAQKHRVGVKQVVLLASDRQAPAREAPILRYGAVQYTSAVHSAQSLFLLAVEFWLMVDAELFLPNVLSSVGWNVCQRRMQMGKDCYQYFTDAHITP
eukprot:GGOE01037783.1.p1 GENE.GGOE01037783.1~~GGOE01037783.1.p1  ORF type:complete len:509 (+),score=111.47 GGOE01037783.1:91-1527(+)